MFRYACGLPQREYLEWIEDRSTVTDINMFDNPLVDRGIATFQTFDDEHQLDAHGDDGIHRRRPRRLRGRRRAHSGAAAGDNCGDADDEEDDDDAYADVD